MRSCPRLALPPGLQDTISKLRITPMTYKPFQKPAPRNYRIQKPVIKSENWRENALVECVRRVREREDPEYSEIFAILNKVTMSSVEKLSNDAITLMNKRDDTFRLRVSTLLFDKAITQHAYASVMAETAKRITKEIPDMKNDLLVQISMFSKLYNINETLTFPCSKEPDFNNKVIEWMTQKEKRRGYSKFMIELCARDLVTEDRVLNGLQDVLNELNEIAIQPKTPQSEENVWQFIVFIFETIKLSNEITQLTSKEFPFKVFLSDKISDILKKDKKELTSLNMKSRFKLEDAFKLTQ